MSDFSTVMNELRPGYIAKTPKMKGYLRLHEVASRVPGESNGYVYTYRGTQAASGSANEANAQAALRLPSGDAESASSAETEVGDLLYEADAVFDLELVENPEWSSADADGQRTYVFRCWQRGASSPDGGFDRRWWRVTRSSQGVPPGGSGAEWGGVDGGNAPVHPSSVVPVALGAAGTDSQGASAQGASDLKVDNDTLGILLAQDWECNRTTEADYVAASTSVRRW